MFPDSSWIGTSTQATTPYPSSDVGALLFFLDETLLSAAIQHLPVLLYAHVQRPGYVLRQFTSALYSCSGNTSLWLFFFFFFCDII